MAPHKGKVIDTSPREARTVTPGKEKAHLGSSGVLNPRRSGPFETVTVLNMTDRPRVVMDMRNKPIALAPGEMVADKEVPTSQIERYKRRVPGLMFLPKEVVEHTEAPLIRYVMDALRSWDDKSEGEAIYIHDKVLGRGHLGIRPSKQVIREALAHRLRDAAQYIASGAYDTAERLLGKGNPEPKLEQGTEPGLKLKDPDLIEGHDDDDTDADAADDTGAGAGADGEAGDGSDEADDRDGTGTGDGADAGPEGHAPGEADADDDGADADQTDAEPEPGEGRRVKSRHAE